MTNKNFLIVLTFFTLLLSGCQQKSSSKSSSNQNALTCTGQAYWTTPGCTGYCQYNPTLCNGSTTGTTTGGTTGGTTSGTTTGGTTGGTTVTNCVSPIAKTCSNYCTTYPGALGCLPTGTNCWISPSADGCPGSSTALNPVWGTHYPEGVPTGVCSSTLPVEAGSAALETRKATVIAASTYGYTPMGAGNYLNTSSMLLTPDKAKLFFMTDSVLKLRIKVKPQQELTGTSSPLFCYGRVRPGTRVPGYTQLQYTVQVYTASGTLIVDSAKTFTTGVNSCSEAIDLSEYKEANPNGIMIGISNVKANQGCWPSVYTGYTSCTSFVNIRSFDCWGLDFEVAADGTKTFD
jgi:hypothetical protein